MITKIQDQDLLELWMYFQSQADRLKERQWNIGTWILSILSGIIVFSVSQETITITQADVIVSKPLAAFVLGVVGILICLYGWIVILDYSKHIQRNWDRADRVKQQISNLDIFWKGKDPNKKRSRWTLPKESIYLIVIIAGFLILYISISFISGLAFNF